MTTSPRTDERPAPPHALDLARAALAHYPECFWFRNPCAEVATIDDVQLVVRRLRQHGNRRAWDAAFQIERCL